MPRQIASASTLLSLFIFLVVPLPIVAEPKGSGYRAPWFECLTPTGWRADVRKDPSTPDRLYEVIFAHRKISGLLFDITVLRITPPQSPELSLAQYEGQVRKGAEAELKANPRSWTFDRRRIGNHEVGYALSNSHRSEAAVYYTVDKSYVFRANWPTEDHESRRLAHEALVNCIESFSPKEPDPGSTKSASDDSKRSEIEGAKVERIGNTELITPDTNDCVVVVGEDAKFHLKCK